MRKLIPALAVLALITGPVDARKLIVDALETHSELFNLPEFTTATVTFMKCGTCAYQTARATAETVYELYGQRVTLAELRSALAKKPAALAVLYRVEDNTLVRISAY